MLYSYIKILKFSILSSFLVSNLLTINCLYQNLPKYCNEDPFVFWSYCFNQPKEKFYWKIFLPDELTESQNFDIVEFLFVLFIEFEGKIYCVISGSGMNVIKKFIHPSFGIDIYQRLANPTEDVIVELKTRGIANNVSQLNQTFNFNQTISETLEYSQIPTKIELKIRKELKDGEFKNYDLDDNFALLEVGSYFLLRKKLDFEKLKELIQDLHRISEENEPKPLTLFSKIDDLSLLNELDEALGRKSPVPVFSKLFMIEIKSKTEQVLKIGDELYGESGLYILNGSIKSGEHEYGPKQILVAKDSTLCEFTISENSTIYIFGGEALPEERFIDWNFVSSDKELIEEAKQKWIDQKFDKSEGDDKEYIPYPTRRL